MASPAMQDRHRRRPHLEGEASSDKPQVFIIGLDSFQRSKLEELSRRRGYDIHPLLDPDAFHDHESYAIDALVDQALSQLRAHGARPDAIVAYMDFPACTMVPILGRLLGIPTPSLDSVLRCEHKYYSRLVQRRAAPEITPSFRLVDPFSDGVVPPLRYPFWVKPIKSWGSYLGFRIDDADDWARAMDRTRARIGRVAEPFDAVLRLAELPPEVADVDGYHCVAEEILTGRQCTLEGFVVDGHVGFHGAVDSARCPNGSTFARYETPSRLPQRVLDRMKDLVRSVVTEIGLDRSGFNVELLWDESRDRIGLIEVNPRVAQHHSDLFQKVNGRSNLEVAVEVALGRRPEPARRAGRHGCAAAIFWREFEDAVVTHVPSRKRLRRIEERFEDTTVEVLVQPGQRLSSLVEQDSYSYACALTYVGARDHAELLDKYRHIEEMLDFGFSRIPNEDGRKHSARSHRARPAKSRRHRERP